MDSPYRSSTLPAPAETPRDTGIVGEIIEQFADRHAFYRELVQNAIDADTAEIDVELQYDSAAERMRVSVRDYGEGMTRDIIEHRLLVLFRSTKEHDDDKIGKFGIGFASVLAISPKIVRVDSVRDGYRNVLHLYPDLSYELFDGGAANKNGTKVELEIPLEASLIDDFVANSWGALERWCQHATVPIHLVHRDGKGHEQLRERIDRPLSLGKAVVQVQATSRDQSTRAVVGITENAEPYAGFFNHGLTLYESEEPLLGRLAFKIQDPRLGHTLSRDNVRRDQCFDRALDFARHLAENVLPQKAATALREAAEHDDKSEFVRLLCVLRRAGVMLSKDELVVPLLEPIRGRRSMNAAVLGNAGNWAAAERGQVTAHLATIGTPVLDLCAEAAEQGPTSFLSVITDSCGKRPRLVNDELTLVTPQMNTITDSLLVDELLALLDDSYRKPSAVIFADLHGVLCDELALAADSDAAAQGLPWVVERERALRNPFGLIRRPPLVLNARAGHVKSARERAATDAATAAGLLARVLLLEREELDADRSERLVVRGLDQLMGRG